MTTTEKMNPNKTARIAGFLYLILLPFGVFSLLYVPSTLIVPGDAATTASNIMASESLFRLGIVFALILQIVNILVVLLLYKLLKPVNKNLAVLMVVFFLVSVPITMLNELNQFAALLLSSGADYLTVFTADQLQALVPLFLDFHEHGLFIAQIFWGLWLFPMGYLVYKSGYIPRVFGVLLIIAGFGYLIYSFGKILFPNYDATIIATIMALTYYGELFLAVWLLIKGENVEQWEKLALESA